MQAREGDPGKVIQGFPPRRGFFQQQDGPIVIGTVRQRDSQGHHRVGDALRITQGPPQLQALVQQIDSIRTSHPPFQVTQREQRGGPRRRRFRAAHGERPPQPGASLEAVAAKRPEPTKRPGQTQNPVGVAGLVQPGQRRPQVGELGLLPVQELRELGLFTAAQCEPLGQCQAPGRVSGANRRLLLARRQPLQPELADRLQHAEARLAVR